MSYSLEDMEKSASNERNGTLSGLQQVQAALTDYLNVGETLDRTTEGEFVQRFENVIEMMKGLKGIHNLYKLNNRTETNLAADLKDLGFLVNEMRAVLTNMSRLRNYKMDVHKEMNVVKRTLDKKSKEQIQDIETIVAIYDKELLKKWHLARKSMSTNSLENFISNVAGKKQAIELVHKLAYDKLIALKKNKIEGNPSVGAFHLRFNAPLQLKNGDTETDSDSQFSQ